MKQEKEDVSWYCGRHNQRFVVTPGMELYHPSICEVCYLKKQTEMDVDLNGRFCNRLIQGCKKKLKQLAAVIKIKLSKQFNKKKQSIKFVSESEEQPKQLISVEKTTNYPKRIQLVSTIYKDKYCKCSAFNNQGSLMFMGCHKKIEIRSFNKRKLLKKLSGHAREVDCIIFSQKQNMFLSRCWNMIILWKLVGSDWISKVTEHQYINNLVLNNEENELISTSKQGSMIVWSLDEQIKFNYDMGILSQEVLYITLNQSNTALVTYKTVPSEGGQILLWTKQKNKWEFQNYIRVNFGGRLSFLSDTEIIFQPCSGNSSNILKLENKRLVMSDQKIKHYNSNFDINFFDIIQNEQRQLIVQKNGVNVIIIQRQLSGRFQILSQPIDCLDFNCNGSMTQDGDYLVISQTYKSQIRIYKITY